jgi:hypothetical protein
MKLDYSSASKENAEPIENGTRGHYLSRDQRTDRHFVVYMKPGSYYRKEFPVWTYTGSLPLL